MNRTRFTFAVGALAASTVAVALLLVLLASSTVLAGEPAQLLAPDDVVNITILHTNDFHGRLEPFNSYDLGYPPPEASGSAYIASVVTDTRIAEGAENVVLMDAGDVFFGAPPISQLLDGESAIDIYNMMGYDVAAIGNHEFDRGQTVLGSRTTQSNFPWISANTVISGTDWDHPAGIKPYVTMTVGSPTPVTLGIIGLTTDETPEVTIKDATAGLVFKDPTEAVLHYYDEVLAQSDALIILAHIGTEDIVPYKGLETVARELVEAGKPVGLMIGGHQHQPLYEPVVVSGTSIIEAGQYGLWLGRADIAIDTSTKSISLIDSGLITITTATITPSAVISDRVAYWANMVGPIVNQPVGITNIDLPHPTRNAETVMGDLVADGMLWKADMVDDGEPNGSVDIAFTNSGGLRTSIMLDTMYDPPTGTVTIPTTITWGNTFEVMPFLNTLYMMDLTGAQIQELLDQAATLSKGVLQSSGITYYFYNDVNGKNPTAWGAYGVEVNGEPLERDRVYRVVTNNFLAPGGDNFDTFEEGTNRVDMTSYDMQEAVNDYIAMISPIDASDISGNRITQLDKVVTILHTNDTHGRWPADTYYGDPNGMVYLATQIANERAKNPNALLLDAGDTFQGNAFAQYFRNATPNPIAGGMNLLEYDAMVIGNHEYNFGPTTFATMLGQLNFPLLGNANVDDDGSYGFLNDNVEDYITVTVDGMEVAILGLTTPSVPLYELPSNIPGLTFYPVTPTVQALLPQIQANEDPDLVVSLNHLGYDVYKGDLNCDTVLAQEIPGLDVIVGGHSHTRLDPAVMVTSTVNPTGTLIAHAYKYALNLGKINVGYTGNVTDGYEIVLREGYLLPASEVSATVDVTMTNYLAPFEAELEAYTEQPIGFTTVPIDSLNGYTEETNGANLQVDAAVFELAENGIDVDFHLSGAMSNKRVPSEGTLGTLLYPLTVGDMYDLMPYENSLVAMSMNGPQLKAVLERAYRNYYYYKYVPGYGGYSHYTTCMLDISEGNEITYKDTYPNLPDGNNVKSLMVGDQSVDFMDATTYYTVSSVNYVAAGSCNFNDDGETLWPLDQLVADTQLYVRDSVINYIMDQGTITPTIEGRLVFVPEFKVFLPLVVKH